MYLLESTHLSTKMSARIRTPTPIKHVMTPRKCGHLYLTRKISHDRNNTTGIVKQSSNWNIQICASEKLRYITSNIPYDHWNGMRWYGIRFSFPFGLNLVWKSHLMPKIQILPTFKILCFAFSDKGYKIRFLVIARMSTLSTKKNPPANRAFES